MSVFAYDCQIRERHLRDRHRPQCCHRLISSLPKVTGEERKRTYTRYDKIDKMRIS